MLAKYVDGFVFVVPKDKVEDYRKIAEEGSKMWMEHGALEYMECMGDDLKSQEMGGVKSLAFTELANAKPDETVWFSFIVYKSKEDRDEINAKVMEEMNKQAEKYKDAPMPFDMRRMAFGGFEVKVEG
jgi:uncharacterized protein YbaA (DUF1428 family)